MALKEGQIIKTSGFKTVKVLRASEDKIELGRGGQGIVYKVEYDGKPMALKWYYKKIFNVYKEDKVTIDSQKSSESQKRFFENLKSNIKHKSPTHKSPVDTFLWPVDLTEESDGTFGYVMPLKPDEYSGFSEYMLAHKSFASTAALLNAALNITTGFMALHRSGYNYQDLNDGNFFVNFNNGDVLICDNDNVMGHGFSSGIAGKLRYMSPDIARDKKTPDVITDRFSLAVVLFILLFASHPLEGRITVKADRSPITDDDIMRFYVTDPVFIFDPKDRRNAPVPQTSANAMRRWGLIPQYIRNLFIEAFDHDRLHGIKPQNIETTWLRALMRWRSEIVICNCGRENYADDAGNFTCNCGFKGRVPAYLVFHDHRIPLFTKAELYACTTKQGNEDFRTKTAEVFAHPDNPRRQFIKNLSDEKWITNNPDGSTFEIKRDQLVVIAKGVSITFGNDLIGKIITI